MIDSVDCSILLIVVFHIVIYITCVEQVYALVYEWSKTKRHASFCFSLMQQMVSLGNQEFYFDPNRTDLLALLVSAISCHLVSNSWFMIYSSIHSFV